MISSYLQLDKAKHGDMIKALDDDYNRLNRLIYEMAYRDWETDRKSTRLNSSHITRSRMPSSA